MGIHRLQTAMTIVVLLALAATVSTPARVMQARSYQLSASALLDRSTAVSVRTATPIKHLVVIYQENVSFDHYFATYPHAANLHGEPRFHAPYRTPRINGLRGRLLTHNPNLRQPFRLDRKQALTCDMDHSYTAEQHAYDGGRMDQFVQWVDRLGPQRNTARYCPRGMVMGYYDGNTVTALWNYALHFAMDDNAHATTFGPSTVGALNLVAGDTAGAVCAPFELQFDIHTCSFRIAPRSLNRKLARILAVHDDIDPYYDDCAQGGPHNKSRTTALITRNIGDLLTAAHITWGWFAGGFANCKATHPAVAYDVQVAGINPARDRSVYPDYDQHEEPFQYFATTSNPHHQRPSSVAMIGRTDRAHHQYDLKDFWQAADAGNLPAVAFLKAPGYQTGHPGISDPLDEQAFLVSTINRLEQLPSWRQTAIILTYDDSDGWYDHDPGKIVNHSAMRFDFRCGSRSDGVPGRCGYGPRIPYLLLSPYARTNVVDHVLIDQSSTLRFIEDNWLRGARLSRESFDNRAGSIAGMFDFGRPPAERLVLDPRTGTVVNAPGTPRAAATSTATSTPTPTRVPTATMTRPPTATATTAPPPPPTATTAPPPSPTATATTAPPPPPTPTATPSVGTISGQVTDSSTSLGIFNAQVTDATGTYVATTDLLGNYDILSVAPGTYTLTASASGYNSASQTVVVANGGVTTASFSLVPLLAATPTPTNTPSTIPPATSTPTATLMPTLTVPPAPSVTATPL